MADESTYVQGTVYREQDTGKIRVKGATRIAPLDADSPTSTLQETIEAVNAMIGLLTDLGVNPES